MTDTPVRDTPPLAGLLRAVLGHLRLLVILPMLGFFGGACIAMSMHQFQADASFTPQGPKNSLSQATSLVQQLGLPLSTGGDNESVDFYRSLIYSRDALLEIAKVTYVFPVRRGSVDTLSGTLADLFKVTSTDPDVRLRSAAGRLRENLTVGLDRLASIVEVRVTTPWPVLSEQVLRQTLEEVNRFNAQRRRTQAAAEREFVGARLAEARQELEAAEDAQRRFVERNRVWQGDPQATIEMQRVTRAVDQRQAVVSNLSQLYEQARIEEVRNTPVITVIQNPEGTARGTSQMVLGAGMGLMFGTLAAISLVLLGEYARRERAMNPAAYREIDDFRHRLTDRILRRRRSA